MNLENHQAQNLTQTGSSVILTSVPLPSPLHPFLKTGKTSMNVLESGQSSYQGHGEEKSEQEEEVWLRGRKGWYLFILEEGTK